MLGPRIRSLREHHGLTQAELARRAGVSRQLIGAVEAGRHRPRIDAAVAIARVLETSVEDLLTPESTPLVGAIDPPEEGQHVHLARVGTQQVCVPVPPSGAGWAPADAVVRGGSLERLRPERPAAVVAGCDPALGLIHRLVEHERTCGVVWASASSADARQALEDGRVHAAVVHGPAGDLPAPDPTIRRWRLTGWQVGLAADATHGPRWAATALAGRLAVVQREEGAASQAALRRATTEAGNDAPPPGPVASGHIEAGRLAQQTGYAAVTIEPVALALGLDFHPLEEHRCEVWVSPDHLDDPGVRRFFDALTDTEVQHRLGAIGGYDLTDCGTEVVG
ncbi:MAG: helix-turn-helix domain-containing protein [Nitriliruptoraceae bacterium]